MEPSQILQLIIQPQYLKYYGDWIHTASQREARGLQLMGAIYKHKGRKQFKAKPPTVQLQELTDQQELDFKKAEEMHRKNQTTSMYSTQFGYLQNVLKPQNNVFKFKKCSEMEFSMPLTDLCKDFMDNWIELNDELEFQELVLACMRALFSRLMAQQVAKSEMKYIHKLTRLKFQNKPDWNLSQPIRVDKAGHDLNAYKTNYNAIFKQRLKQEQIKEKIKELNKTEFAKSLLIHKSFKIN